MGWASKKRGTGKARIDIRLQRAMTRRDYVTPMEYPGHYKDYSIEVDTENWAVPPDNYKPHTWYNRGGGQFNRGRKPNE